MPSQYPKLQVNDNLEYITWFSVILNFDWSVASFGSEIFDIMANFISF